MKTIDLSGRPFHFIGIGGIGMSALAHILAKRELPVSGSDLRESHITQRLRSLGVRIFNGQEAANLDWFQPRNYSSSQQYRDNLPQVICSTAISSKNPEYQAATERGYPIFHRSDLLASLIEDYQSIAVAGTHGKTTTSSLIGYILFFAGLDPTIIVGGEVDAWQGNARLGRGNLLVAEADESDGSLIKHSPQIGVVTNIELDHPDRYQNLEEVVEIFKEFGSQCQTLIGCIDCETVQKELKPQITYSTDLNKGADYTVGEIIYHPGGCTARVWERGKLLGIMRSPLLGEHNLSNALAAIAVGRLHGLEFEVIAEAIASFEGAKRRFEYRGKSNGITFVDDYAHHPSEIRATLAGARLLLNKDSHQRIVAIFQPHRYSRTLTFLQEFGSAFSDADLVVVTDIYSAGEVNPGTITGNQVAQEISSHRDRVIYHRAIDSLSSFLAEILQPGDLALFLGAGNVNQTIPEVMSIFCSERRKLA
ncbi:MAG: UDP-N-acetylmuramate--L-alanine ligase [Prochloraceae cyanobacterium]|nr:UDP-N-acetylmuramate--L-alanine ligase [Prochloraceae cyanobacterium]